MVMCFFVSQNSHRMTKAITGNCSYNFFFKFKGREDFLEWEKFNNKKKTNPLKKFRISASLLCDRLKSIERIPRLAGDVNGAIAPGELETLIMPESIISIKLFINH